MNVMLQIVRWGTVVSVIGCCTVAAERVETPPSMKANTNVPLVKVAEHHMLMPRLGPAAVASGNFVYIIGGWDDRSPLTSVERFDVRTGESERFAELKIGRLWHSAVLIDDRIYVLGGLANEETDAPLNLRANVIDRDGRTLGIGPDGMPLGPTRSVEIVNLSTRTVERGPDLPQAIEEFGAVALGRNVVTFGGNTSREGRMTCTNAVSILNLATGKWSSGPPTPRPRLAPATVIPGGLVLYAGGYNLQRMVADVDVFNPRDGTWRTLPPLCQPMGAPSMLFAGHSLFLFGSYENPDELVAYDLKTRKSEMFKLGCTVARHTAAVIIGNRVYVVGGRVHRDLSPIDLVQVFEMSTEAAGTPVPAR